MPDVSARSTSVPAPHSLEVAAVWQAMVQKVLTVTEDTPLAAATKMMGEHRIRHIPVINAENVPIGIFSDRDLFKFFASQLASGQKVHPLLSVKELMTRFPITVTAETLLRDAARILDDKKIGCVLVVDRHRRLSGILTKGNVLKFFAGRSTPSTEPEPVEAELEMAAAN